nr:hypothetical protein Iba_chr04bCG19300 [Ipomoea batatas]
MPAASLGSICMPDDCPRSDSPQREFSDLPSSPAFIDERLVEECQGMHLRRQCRRWRGRRFLRDRYFLAAFSYIGLHTFCVGNDTPSTTVLPLLQWGETDSPSSRRLALRRSRKNPRSQTAAPNKTVPQLQRGEEFENFKSNLKNADDNGSLITIQSIVNRSHYVKYPRCNLLVLNLPYGVSDVVIQLDFAAEAVGIVGFHDGNAQIGGFGVRAEPLYFSFLGVCEGDLLEKQNGDDDE